MLYILKRFFSVGAMASSNSTTQLTGPPVNQNVPQLAQVQDLSETAKAPAFLRLPLEMRWGIYKYIVPDCPLREEFMEFFYGTTVFAMEYAVDQLKFAGSIYQMGLVHDNNNLEPFRWLTKIHVHLTLSVPDALFCPNSGTNPTAETNSSTHPVVRSLAHHPNQLRTVVIKHIELDASMTLVRLIKEQMGRQELDLEATAIFQRVIDWNLKSFWPLVSRGAKVVFEAASAVELSKRRHGELDWLNYIEDCGRFHEAEKVHDKVVEMAREAIRSMIPKEKA
ncbi:hypothetical protein BT63DRAFT_479384 [Microthyrium microscopicum]|uniref:Uncharacterized protein n=1 Tax=Microthyrium microscopicum TaxID=703497 RepID=A0A6A6UER0_9PEZI|nr:hypothetical protein BT63DRAFT_479384 [Microthyrium microscopicum]